MPRKSMYSKSIETLGICLKDYYDNKAITVLAKGGEAWVREVCYEEYCKQVRGALKKATQKECFALRIEP